MYFYFPVSNQYENKENSGYYVSILYFRHVFKTFKLPLIGVVLLYKDTKNYEN